MLYFNRTRFLAIASRFFYKIAYKFKNDFIKSLQKLKDYWKEPGINTQSNNDFVKTVLVA